MLASYAGDPNSSFQSDGAVVLDGATGDVVRQVPLAAGATALAVAADGSVFVGMPAGSDSVIKLTPDLAILDPATVVCVAIGSNGAGAAPVASARAAVRSTLTAPTGKPVASVAPRVEGAAIEGETLSCTDASWAQALGSDSLGWRRDGVDVGASARGGRPRCVPGASWGSWQAVTPMRSPGREASVGKTSRVRDEDAGTSHSRGP